MALNVRGWTHLCQGRRHEALEDFSRAIELDEELAEAYNNRSIARRLEGVEGAAEDEDLADALTMHDLEAQMRLRQQRKWMCIGYNARGEPEGEKLATDADFLISFASPDKDDNNRILHELKTGVNYDGSLRFLPSCRWNRSGGFTVMRLFCLMFQFAVNIVYLLALHKSLFELRTGDLLHRQVTGNGAPHQRNARDETLEPDFLGPGSAPAAGRISSLVQALQRGRQ